MQEVADGILVSVGALQEPTTENRGEIATVGFILAREGSFAIDSGTSFAQAERLAAALRAQHAPPVIAVVNTAVNPERIFGNARYADLPLYAHPDAARLMRERCELCLERLQRELGADVMAGTRLVVPSVPLNAGDRLPAGGREVVVLYFGTSASPGALALYDRRTSVLFAGALAAFGRVPEVRDADLDQWLTAIDAILALQPRVIVPGWGPPGGAAELLPMRSYLVALKTRVSALLDQGVGLVDAPREADLAEYRRWPLYTELHRRNVHDLYVALERERFEKEQAKR